jgi:hypothetical protein
LFHQAETPLKSIPLRSKDKAEEVAFACAGMTKFKFLVIS